MEKEEDKTGPQKESQPHFLPFSLFFIVLCYEVLHARSVIYIPYLGCLFWKKLAAQLRESCWFLLLLSSSFSRNDCEKITLPSKRGTSPEIYTVIRSDIYLLLPRPPVINSKRERRKKKKKTGLTHSKIYPGKEENKKGFHTGL